MELTQTHETMPEIPHYLVLFKILDPVSIVHVFCWTQLWAWGQTHIYETIKAEVSYTLQQVFRLNTTQATLDTTARTGLDYLLFPQFNLDINLADRNGITALHLASTNCASRVSK